MKIVPLHIKQANEYVKQFHRHNKPVLSAKISIGVEKNGKLVGVALAGRPVSRHLDNGKTLEVYRVCTDGTFNATSFLYSRVKKIAQLMGYEKIITYTLQSESGASLRAIGASIDKNVEHQRQWNSTDKVKRNYQEVTEQLKFRWVL